MNNDFNPTLIAHLKGIIEVIMDRIGMPYHWQKRLWERGIDDFNQQEQEQMEKTFHKAYTTITENLIENENIYKKLLISHPLS